MAQKVQLKRSSVVTNGAPKLPTTSQVEVGELTINFAEGYETLSTKNSNNNIATFSSDAVLDRKYISSGAVVSAVSAVSKTIEDNEYVIAQTFNDQHERLLALENAGFLTGYTETDPTVPSWAKQSSKPTYTAAEVGAMATSERSNYLGTGTTYFDDVEYDSNTKRINFKKNNSVIDYVDATAFIKDGMVSSVTISNGNLVVSFNTDAGKEDITLALTQIFNPNNYYDKTTADGKFLSTATTIPNDSNLMHKTGNETVGPYANKLFNDSMLKFSAVTDDAGVLLLQGAFIRKQGFNEYESTSRPFDFIESFDSVQGDITLQDVLNTKITSADTPTEASILSSGFTKNAITAVTINGNPASVSNGVATANVTGLPSVTSSDNGKVLMVSNGQWAPVMPVTVYSGNMAPDNVLGNNGDIYLQTS